MPSKIEDVVFGEPSGGLNAIVMIAGALLFLSIYVYYDILRDASAVHLLILAVGSGLSGIAESLPGERRRTAGALRVTAILLMVGLLGLIVFAPDVVLNHDGVLSHLYSGSDP